MSQPINIYHFLRKFNQTFGHDAICMQIQTMNQEAIYVQMLYNQGITAPLCEHWNNSEYINYPRNYGMCRVVLKEKSDSQDIVPVIYHNDIYINPFVMPDYKLASKFIKAREQHFGNDKDSRFRYTEVNLDHKFLQRALQLNKITIEKNLNVYQYHQTQLRYAHDTYDKQLETYANHLEEQLGLIHMKQKLDWLYEQSKKFITTII